MNLQVFGIPGLPEVGEGDDIAALVPADMVEDGDVLVVTSKIVSKAEGRVLVADDREKAIDAETVRVVARRRHARGETRIVETRQGLVLAAAGVDASNTAPVQVAGRRYAVAGRVCMDQFVLDLGRDTRAVAGDEAVLFGVGADGEPTAQDWAEAAGTINYEIVTRLGSRVPRVHVGADA